MGLTANEAAVLERFDSGQSIQQIARATGFLRRTVQEMISRYDVSLAQDARYELALRSQSAQLGELVRQAGGHR